MDLKINRSLELPLQGQRKQVANITSGDTLLATVEVRHSRTNAGFYRAIGKRVNVARGPAGVYDTDRFYSAICVQRDIANFLGDLVQDILVAENTYGAAGVAR